MILTNYFYFIYMDAYHFKFEFSTGKEFDI